MEIAATDYVSVARALHALCERERETARKNAR